MIAYYQAFHTWISSLINVDKKTLLNEYRAIHQAKGSVEYPYATVHLPSVHKAYPNSTQRELVDILNPAFHKFNSVRKSKLQLYPGVENTLTTLTQMGLLIVGYTESAEENGFYRLQKLGIDKLFEKVYVSNSQYEKLNHFPTTDKTKIVSGAKPNPDLLKQICILENISPLEAIYIGDSLTKDIYMAKTAGITSVLCKYPTAESESADMYRKLVAISNWTVNDFEREAKLKKECEEKCILPDYTVNSFDSIVPIIKRINELM